MQPVLETERIRLCNWSMADIADLYSICADPQVMRFVGSGDPWSEERTRAFLAGEIQNAQQHGYCRWALHHKGDARLIGFTGFVPHSAGVEIGWRLSRDYWGRGLATEAARQAVHYAFETLKVAHITATVQLGNQASIRVIEKIGLRQESQSNAGPGHLLRFSKAAPNPSAKQQ